MPCTDHLQRRRFPARFFRARGVALVIALLSAGNAAAEGSAHAHDNQWRFAFELGVGVKHNNDGGALLWRGRFGDDDWGGCGFVLGGWTGRWRNQVAGLNCEKRIRVGWFHDRRFFAGIGMVDIEPGTIVNSSWAFEVHLRYMLSNRTAVSITHYSNAGTHSPNRGFNFFSLEVIL